MKKILEDNKKEIAPELKRNHFIYISLFDNAYKTYICKNRNR